MGVLKTGSSSGSEKAADGKGEPKPVSSPFTVKLNWHGVVHTIRTSAFSEAKARSNAIYRLAQDIGQRPALIFQQFKDKEVIVERGH